jgi:hypothetical protein
MVLIPASFSDTVASIIIVFLSRNTVIVGRAYICFSANNPLKLFFVQTKYAIFLSILGAHGF